MAAVTIIHAPQDEAIASLIAAELLQRGLDIRGGNTSAVVLLNSLSLTGSLLAEAQAAGRGKPVILALLDAAPAPAGIAASTTINFRLLPSASASTPLQALIYAVEDAATGAVGAAPDANRRTYTWLRLASVATVMSATLFGAVGLSAIHRFVENHMEGEPVPRDTATATETTTVPSTPFSPPASAATEPPPAGPSAAELEAERLRAEREAVELARRAAEATRAPATRPPSPSPPRPEPPPSPTRPPDVPVYEPARPSTPPPDAGTHVGGLPPPVTSAPAPAYCPTQPLQVTVHFDADSVRPTMASSQMLLTGVELARANGCRIMQIEIGAHTDAKLSREASLALSAKRADAVRQLLLEQGLPSTVVRTVSYGAERPVVAAPAGVAAPENNRAEVKITVAQ